jgi:hypothetical protein
MDWDQLISLATSESSLLGLYLLNGVFFHFQTICNYVLMDYISPVTQR